MKPQIGNLKDSEGQVWNGVKETKTGSRTLLVVGACVFLALMTAAILGSVYLGYSLHPLGLTGKQQTYTADFYQDGHHVVKETLVITERESMYAATNGTVVKDYETGFLVYKMDHLPGCYLTTFNMSDKDNYSSNGQQQIPRMTVRWLKEQQTMSSSYVPADADVQSL
ncbi:hypothetical protein MAR_035760 [Mya arenaria]|uniref:Uncharacterized protein n=1 Tax=Mya arenaria TaxID=6604 RepID=A0ABY7EQK6_MYAAR|nr:hypothetical protein MAR_035760 [Mya arenaria]